MANILWEPSEQKIQQANLTQFIQFVNEKYGLSISDYPSLYQWSIENIADFWAYMW